MEPSMTPPRTAEPELPPGLSPDDLRLAPSPSADLPGRDDHTIHEAIRAHELQEQAGPSWADFAQGWDRGIYRDPVLCGGLAGLVLGLLGVFIVLRRAVFVTAAVSQAAGLGVALAFYLAIHHSLDVPPVVAALVLGVTATMSLALPVHRLRLPRESALGLCFIAASALAVLVGDRIGQEAHDVAGILFGTAVLVRRSDLWAVAIVGGVTTLVVAVFYRGLVFAGFDPEGARVQKLPVRGLNLLFWALVAIEVSVATRALGALPVFAFAVIPAMAALPLVRRLPYALIGAALIGGASGALGYLFAFFFQFPVGASQAVVAVVIWLGMLPVGALRRTR
jgi:zinc transport system permease protein